MIVVVFSGPCNPIEEVVTLAPPPHTTPCDQAHLVRKEPGATVVRCNDVHCTPPPTVLKELGRGCSGVVYVGADAEGLPIARKVFGSTGLTKLVQLAFLGAPNPYMWNESAIRCAHLRLEILAELVNQWFGPRMYVARTRGWAWNQDERAFELRTQLVDGRPPDLRHPLRDPHPDQTSELANDLLPRLQKLLVESGFDGMVWQAGKETPSPSTIFSSIAAGTRVDRRDGRGSTSNPGFRRLLR